MEKSLELLAEKLGTSVEYMWDILLKQVPINLTMNIVFVGFCLLFCVGVLVAHLKLSKKRDWGDDYIESGYNYYEDSAQIPMVILAVAGVILFMVSLAIIPTIVTMIVNPEFWALKQIFGS